MGGTARHFVLVHGACHGGWCWFKVAKLLEAVGHRVTALDLAASGINPRQLSDIHSISDYFEPLFTYMAALPQDERVILVGHSRGGIAIAAAMEKFPQKIAVGVFISAFMPGPNFTLIDINKIFNEGTSGGNPDHDTITRYDEDHRITSLLFGPNTLANALYQYSPSEVRNRMNKRPPLEHMDCKLATLLMRPYPYYDDERSLNETTLTKENYGSIPRVFIMAGQDPLRFMIENNPPNEIMGIPNADHMVMFSKPQELFSNLHAIAENYSGQCKCHYNIVYNVHHYAEPMYSKGTINSSKVLLRSFTQVLFSCWDIYGVSDVF